MSNRNKLEREYSRARAKAAKLPMPCGDCGYRHCKCEGEPETEMGGDCLSPAEVKAIVSDCVSDLGLTNENESKLIAELCISQNAVTPISEERIKEIVESCVATNAEIKTIVLQCLLDQGDALDSEAVEGIFTSLFDQIEIPSAVTDSHIKVVALQCILDNKVTDEHIKSIAEGCIPEPVDVKPVVLQCLLDNPQLSEPEVKLIFNQCIDGLIPDEAKIKEIFIQCLSDWEIAPECIKDFVVKCVIELLPRPLSTCEIKSIFEECSEGQLHTADQIKIMILECMNGSGGKQWTELELKTLIDTCVKTDAQLKLFIEQCVDVPSQALIENIAKTIALQCIQDNAPPAPLTVAEINALITALIRTDAEIKAIVDECVTDEGIKVLVLECLNAIPGKQWTQDEIKFLVESCTKTDEQLKQFIQDCVDIPSEALINQLAKTVALQCISDNQQEVPTETEIKALIFDCLKQIALETNVDSVDVDVQCVNNTLEVEVNVDGVVGSATADMSKFEQQPYPVTEFCFSYDNGTVFQAVNDKVEIPFDLKVLNWDSGFTHVPYDTQFKCLEIPYVGPTKDDINACIVQALSELEPNETLTPRTDAEIKQIAQACIDLLPTAPSYCLTGANVSVVGSQVTVSLTQENCPTPVDFTFNVGSDSSVECCNTGLALSVVGTDLKVALSQSNGPNFNESVSLTSLAGQDGADGVNGQDGTNGADGADGTQITCEAVDGVTTIYGDGIALCSITGGSSSVEVGGGTAIQNADGSFTINLTDTAGAATSITIPAPQSQPVISCVSATHTDGCSAYESLRVDGVEICKLQPFEPKTPACKKFCLDDYTGTQSVTAGAYNLVVNWTEAESVTIEAGQTESFNYASYTGPILICFADPCLTDEQTLYSTMAASPALSCC